MSVSRSTKRLRATPESGPRAGRSVKTRAEIQDAAFEFLWSRPFREMTVNSLMATTRVSRPAFYQYFRDVHELMESLLVTLENEIIDVARPWLFGESGDAVAMLHESLNGLVTVCYRRGPFLKAVADAAPMDARLEKSWNALLGRFDEAVAERIRLDQAQGLIEAFDPRAVAVAFNRLDAYTFVQSFGQRPRSEPGPIRDAIVRTWVSTLYGRKWVGASESDLVRG